MTSFLRILISTTSCNFGEGLECNIFFPCMISKMLSKVKKKEMIPVKSFCDFLNNINFNRLQITLDDYRELCFKL